MKFLKIAGVSAIVIIALAVLGVTLAFAQKPSPTDTPNWWNGMRSRMQGYGMMGNGNGMMGRGATNSSGATNGGGWQSMQQMHEQMSQSGGMGAMHEWMHQTGGVHDTVWKALADKLGLTTDELTTEINSGKTLAQVAQEKGVSTKDLATVMETTMEAAITQAVKDGKLTQAQADLMIQHMDGQYEWMITNMGAGMMGPGAGGMMGPGSGGCHNNGQQTQDKNSL